MAVTFLLGKENFSAAEMRLLSMCTRKVETQLFLLNTIMDQKITENDLISERNKEKEPEEKLFIWKNRSFILCHYENIYLNVIKQIKGGILDTADYLTLIRLYNNTNNPNKVIDFSLKALTTPPEKWPSKGWSCPYYQTRNSLQCSLARFYYKIGNYSTPSGLVVESM